MAVVPSRRDRLRASTISDIKQVARAHLLEHGADGISHRAIARDIGMSSPGLSRYFPSRDALLTAITADAYDDLTTTVEQARDGVGESDVAGRFTAAARALRRWAQAHPAEFRLTFDKPPMGRAQRLLAAQLDPRDVAGQVVHDCDDAGLRFGAVFAHLVAQLWSQGPFRVPERDAVDPALWAQLDTVTDEVNARLPDDRQLPAGAVLVFLTSWAKLYGLVAVEAFGHQRWALNDPEPLFELGLADVMETFRPTA